MTTSLKLLMLCFLLFVPSVHAASFAEQLAEAALQRTNHLVSYDGRYFNIGYPGGDVAPDLGVCTDVVIRSYRVLGIDLQVDVHEDIRSHFAAYPARRIWAQTRPDTNIDHRRVPNLQVFFTRLGQSLPVSADKNAYLPGDLVTWMLPGNLPHIGVVSMQKSLSGKRPLIVHNMGRGPRLEDMLFDFPITGHYRYQPRR